MSAFLKEIWQEISAHWAAACDTVSDGVHACADLYQSNPAVRAAVDGIAILGFLTLADMVAGHPLALRMMFITPIWYAAQRGGRGAGSILVVLTTCAVSLIDLSSRMRSSDSWSLHFLTTFAIFYALMRLIESVETRLQSYATLATRDALTGIPNRMALEEFGARAIGRCLRSGEMLSVAMIDCDRFKHLNDEFGHGYGDHVLRTLAKILRRAVQSSGIAARNGGDEFVLVMPGRHPDEVAKLMEKVSVRFAEATTEMSGAATVSYGLATLGRDGETLHELLKRADERMYRQKTLARGQAVVEFTHEEHVA